MLSRLEVTASLSDKIFLGSRTAQLEIGDIPPNISRINLSVDSNNYYTAGDDTGRVLEASCPWGSQAMANSILAAVKNYSYQPYTAEDALLDPAAELGDAVTVGGIYSVISSVNMDFDRACAPTISAPESDEIDDEYPYESRERRETNRQLAQTRSLISKTSEQILLQVENEINGLSASIDLQLDSITSTVQGQGGQISSIQQTVSSITQQITGINGDISSIEQYVDSITLSVSNGSTSSTISLKAGSTTIASQTITMSGLVTFTGLSNGTTTINGACIKTGTISANRLDLTGAITFSDLSTSVQNDINDAYSMAQDAQDIAWDVDDTVSGWTYRGTTKIDGSMIETGTVMASYLIGGNVRLLTSSERIAGEIGITGASSSTYKVVIAGAGALELVAEDGDVYIESTYGYVTLDGGEGITCMNDFYPSRDSYYDLGTGSFYWDTIYANTSQATTSDRNKKNTITYNMAPYEALFDALRPTPYKLNNGTSGRTHLGLISQDVEEALTACGLTDMDFAGFIKSPAVDETKQETGEYNYALRYGEFIAMLIHEVQMLKARVAELEAA